MNASTKRRSRQGDPITLPTEQAPAAPSRATAVARAVVAQLRTPHARDSYVLTANFVLTAGLGFLGWALAARHYAPSEVGAVSGLVAACTLITLFSGLGLGGTILRFLPSLAGRQRPILTTAYVSTIVASALGALVFLLVNLWRPGPLAGQPLVQLGLASFVGAAGLACAGVLDAVSLSQGKPQHILARTLITGTLRVALVFMLAGHGVPALLVANVGPVALVTFGVLAWEAAPALGRMRRLAPSEWFWGEGRGKYAIQTAFADSLSAAGFQSLPLVALYMLGTEATAVFYMTWSIAAVGFFLPSAIALSLFARGSRSEADTSPRGVRGFILFGMAIAVAGLVGLTIAGSVALSWLGDLYQDQGTLPLAILLLAAIPLTVTRVLISLLRIERRMSRVVATNLLISALALGLGIAFAPAWGLVGLAWAWTLAQAVASVGLFALERRRVIGPATT